MNAIATIYIPYSPQHEQLRFRAIQSAYAQTVKCDVLCAPSPNTPATFRNKAMTAITPLICFLDADDILVPTFLEKCIRVYEQGKYVYTNWLDGNVLRKPRECAWSADSHHIVTTLYPTELFAWLGGFNEQLPGHEDADFYMRSYTNRICGVHVDEALVIRPDDTGHRSKAFHARQDYNDILASVAEKNGGMNRIMGCCGIPSTPGQADPGAGKPGDVLAETIWAGMHSEYSPYSDRLYVGGNNTVINVAPIDIEMMPDKFKAVRDVRNLAPTREKILKESGLV